MAKEFRQVMTNAEAILWSGLRCDAIDGYRFRRQHPIGAYIADFACVAAKLVIEIDGATHGSPAEIAHEVRRTRFVKKLGRRAIRFANGDIFYDLTGALDAIARQLHPHLPSTSRRSAPPPAEGRGRGTVSRKAGRP